MFPGKAAFWDRLHVCELWAVWWIYGLQSNAKVNSRFATYLFSLLLLVILWRNFFLPQYRTRRALASSSEK